jgi:hypothetical protein
MHQRLLGAVPTSTKLHYFLGRSSHYGWWFERPGILGPLCTTLQVKGGLSWAGLSSLEPSSTPQPVIVWQTGALARTVACYRGA